MDNINKIAVDLFVKRMQVYWSTLENYTNTITPEATKNWFNECKEMAKVIVVEITESK